eukprot:13412913-Ditylum_brightwellii.AAC.1
MMERWRQQAEKEEPQPQPASGIAPVGLMGKVTMACFSRLATLPPLVCAGQVTDPANNRVPWDQRRSMVIVAPLEAPVEEAMEEVKRSRGIAVLQLSYVPGGEPGAAQWEEWTR